MIDLTEAWRRVAATVRPLDAIELDLPLAVATGSPAYAIAEPLIADRDLPGFDRSMLDGIVMRGDEPHAAADPSADRSTGCRIASEDSVGAAEPIVLRIVDEVSAGNVSRRAIGLGEAIRIMTGAPVPSGGSAVVPIERLIEIDGPVGSSRVVGVARGSIRAGQNIQRQGEIARAGAELLPIGRRLGAAEIGLAAEIGATRLSVARPVRAAVITTGDELVDASQVPAEGQIRDSNGPMLAAALCRWGCDVVLRMHATDRVEVLDAALAQADAAGADLIVLAGGVSAGKKDHVPARLEAFGAVCRFHKLSLKPGKPLWFGERDAPRGRTWCFGLPGNPISSLIGAELFVRPLIEALGGAPFRPPLGLPLPLLGEFRHRGDRPTFWPAVIEERGDEVGARPLAWLGSADLPRTAQADGWIAFPAGDRTWNDGERLRFVRRTV